MLNMNTEHPRAILPASALDPCSEPPGDGDVGSFAEATSSRSATMDGEQVAG